MIYKKKKREKIDKNILNSENDGREMIKISGGGFNFSSVRMHQGSKEKDE